MSKRLRWPLAVLAAFSLAAAACGGDDDDDSGDDAATTEAPDTGDDTAATTAPDDGDDMGDAGPIWVLLPDSASSPRWEADDRPAVRQ